MKKIKYLTAALAHLLAPVITMANAIDHRAMLLKLLGCDDNADEAMVNTRYNEAMAAEPDEDDKKLAEATKANAKLTADLVAANEKAAKAVAPKPVKVTVLGDELSITVANDGDPAAIDAIVAKVTEKVAAATKRATDAEATFANERKERIKILLDTAVTANRITGAERTALEAEFANAFDVTLAKLAEKKGAALPNGGQAKGVGARRAGLLTSEDATRRDKIGEFVNEEMKKPQYRNAADGEKYSAAFTAVLKAHPELNENK